MKAAYITQPGPPQSILYGELPAPTPNSDECLIEVKAVAVNPIDTYLRGGMIPMKIPFPYIIGCDVAGVVIETGSQVTRFKKGDRVWGSNQGLLGRQGTFAEQVSVQEKWLYSTPPNVSDEEAAAISLVGITAHLGLFPIGRLGAGEIVFVNGGSGGVGSAVLQMAKAAGAKAITTAGSTEKEEICRKLGADHVVNYRSQNVADEVKKFAPAGVNLWWETLREPNFDLAIGSLAPRGRMIVMAGRDARPQFPVGPFYVKGCSLHGFAMFNSSSEEQRRSVEDINRWLSEGKLKPVIGRVLPLSQAAQAHALQEEKTLRNSASISGKIVLKPEA